MKKVFVLIMAVSLALLFTVYFFAMQKPLREYEKEKNVRNNINQNDANLEKYENSI